MNKYYILEETFHKEKAYLYDIKIDANIINKIRKGESLNDDSVKDIEFVYKDQGLKDFLESAKVTLVSDKFIKVLNSLSISNFFAYPIKLFDFKKVHIHTNYFLFVPEVVSFFDYKKSEYDGIEEERIIGEIYKMVVDKDKIADRKICRFYELITDILIDETLKIALEKEGIKGLNYIPTDEFKFPYF